MRTRRLVVLAVASAAVAAAAAGADTFNGAINGTEVAHGDFIVGQAPVSSCAPPKSPLVASDVAQLHFDTYPIAATTSTCFTIQLTVPANAMGTAYSVAYLNAFDRTNIGANYLGDVSVADGVQPGQTKSYSVEVPANNSLVAEVEEFDAGAGVSAYTLVVTGGSTTAVQLTAFSARARGRTIEVTWRTANETDTAGFELHRIAGGKRVALKNALIPAKQAGRAAGAAYRVVDSHGAPGKVTYRLRVVRLDGTRAWIGLAVVAR